MHIDELRAYCLEKRGVSESFPFDAQTLVFKVGGKMFALGDIDFFEALTLKVAPEELNELVEQYEAVTPGYHMNKKHWVTVQMNGSIADSQIFAWVDNSYHLIFDKLPKKLQNDILNADDNMDIVG